MSKSEKEAARSIVAIMREQFSAPHTMVSADESEFGHLDLGAYARFQAEMEAARFQALGDAEILEVSNSPTTLFARTMVRIMLSADGCVYAGYYQLKPRIWRRLKMLFRGLLNLRFIAAPKNFLGGMATLHCVEFETEFSDGRQLVTSNAQAASLVSGPPSIESTYFSYDTPGSFLLEYHLRRLAEVAASATPLHPVVMGSLEDVLAMQKRQNMQKVAHRTAVQWVTQGELRGMAKGQVEQSEAIFAEVQKLLNEERGAV